MRLIARLRSASARDEGVTLIELVVCVAIVGVIVVSLTGVVMAYLKTSVSAAARMTESHDVQFAAAYWQRDVASIGVRSTVYDNAPGGTHSFALQQSVGVSATCVLPVGTTVVTLAWSSYVSTVSDAVPDTVTVTYLAQAHGTGSALRYDLVRRRCTGASIDSTTTVADNLASIPTISCPTSCTGSGNQVPSAVSITLAPNDPDGHHTTGPSTTLSGERRQS